jgi:ABC-2 type transport system ATP-binding protein
VRASAPGRLQDLLEAEGAEVEDQGSALIVRGVPIEEIGQRAFDAGIALHELAPHAVSLEERFLRWTGDAERPQGDGAGEVPEP